MGVQLPVLVSFLYMYFCLLSVIKEIQNLVFTFCVLQKRIPYFDFLTDLQIRLHN